MEYYLPRLLWNIIYLGYYGILFTWVIMEYYVPRLLWNFIYLGYYGILFTWVIMEYYLPGLLWNIIYLGYSGILFTWVIMEYYLPGLLAQSRQPAQTIPLLRPSSFSVDTPNRYSCAEDSVKLYGCVTFVSH